MAKKGYGRQQDNETDKLMKVSMSIKGTYFALWGILFFYMLIIFTVFNKKDTETINVLEDKRTALVEQRLRIKFNIENTTKELKKIDLEIINLNEKISTLKEE